MYLYENLLTTDLTCKSFPGPGAEDRVLMNPMTEYINKDEEHIHVMFDQFKRTHNKKYKNEIQHENRKNIFRQNVRYILKLI